MGKPKKAWILVRIDVDMEGWDDDVDWSDPKKVIEDQVDCVGLRRACNTDMCKLLAIEWDE